MPPDPALDPSDTVSLFGAAGLAVHGRRSAGEWVWSWPGAQARYRPDGTGRALLEVTAGTSSVAEAAAGLRAVLDRAFAGDGIEVFGWQAPVDDLTTRRIVWSCGFTVDGRWRGQHRGPNGPVDLSIGSLLCSEPRTPRHPWWEPAVLTGERIRLRPWRAEDAPPERPDAESEQFAPGMQPAPEDYRRWWDTQRDRMARGQAVFWCIADLDADTPLGGVQLTELDSRRTAGTGWLGYFLYPAARGRGALADALDLLVPHAFRARTDGSGSTGLGLHRLSAGTDIANRASQRVLRRSGFRQVALERAVLARDGMVPAGALTFELLAVDDQVAQSVEPGEVPVLTTDRLRLRPWTPADAPQGDAPLDTLAHRYLPAAALPGVATFASWLQQRTIDIDRGVAVTWCLAGAADDRPLGSMAVFDIDGTAPGNAELGYWLYPAARQQGLLTEALPAVIGYAFTAADRGGLGLHRLHAAADLENVASRRALERAGFSRWGRDHSSTARRDGTLADLAHYELLAPGR